MTKRVALVIGNGKYTEAGFLKNPANDAIAISAALTQFGFQITGGPQDGIDLGYGRFAERIRDFGRNLKEASVALLFYAGHGLQVAGRNYLVPVDAALEQEADVNLELIELQAVLNQMERPGRTSIVILDACRNNPLARNLARAMGLDMRAAGITEGLAEQKVVAGTLIAFATQPGHVAYDGAGSNGYFTEALLEQLQHDAARDFELLLRDVRARVVSATRTKAMGAQVPWVHSALMGAFSFVPMTAQKTPPEQDKTAPEPPRPAGTMDWSASSSEWERIKDISDIARLKHFAKHAHPYHADLARDRVQFLEAEVARREGERAEAEARRKREEEEDRRAGIVRVSVGTGAGKDEVRRMKPGSAESFQDAPFAPEMVVVPAGEFMMGSPADEPERLDSEGPQHRVIIPHPFAVGRYAVTFDEWDAAQADRDWQRITGIEPRKPGDSGWGRSDRPAINVSWEDAQAYVKWLSEKTGKEYRLLSEAEWEYAARAGNTTPFWWGKAITPDQANYNGEYTYAGGGKKGEYREKTVPVKSFQPNPWGLYQVHGNVYEWCEDVWHDDYNDAPTDGSAWTTGGGGHRVLRGGSWLNVPWDLRAAYRNGGSPVDRDSIVGFRVSRTLLL